MTDTSREAIERLLAALKDEAAMLDAVREDGLSTLLSNGTVDRLRLGTRAAYVVMDALGTERDALRAEIERLGRDYNAVCDERDATVQAERTAREQAERNYNDALLALSVARDYAHEQHQRAEQAEARGRELEAELAQRADTVRQILREAQP